MDQLSDRELDESRAQVSQWLFMSSWRRRRGSIALLLGALGLVALVVVGLLALTAVFFPR